MYNVPESENKPEEAVNSKDKKKKKKEKIFIESDGFFEMKDYVKKDDQDDN